MKALTPWFFSGADWSAPNGSKVTNPSSTVDPDFGRQSALVVGTRPVIIGLSPTTPSCWIGLVVIHED